MLGLIARGKGDPMQATDPAMAEAGYCDLQPGPRSGHGCRPSSLGRGSVDPARAFAA
jgi:hypothetical protein